MSSIPAARKLHVETPEGVSVELALGTATDRAIAFLIDATLIVVVFFGLMLLAAMTGSFWAIAFMISLTFVFRIFYFVGYEACGRGATIGKRLMKLRVVRADGGPLTIDAVLTRNFTRELEIFVPLAFLLAPNQFWEGHSGWMRLIGSLWIFVIPTMPMWSRSRVRLGDLVGGTRVVRAPKAVLLSDMARQRDPIAGNAAPAAIQLTFRAEQMGVYGIYELQVLEDVLRKRAQPGGKEAIAAVTKRIKTKIRWDDTIQGTCPDHTFLGQFYAAQRKHLEQQLLFGKRKERKQD